MTNFHHSLYLAPHLPIVFTIAFLVVIASIVAYQFFVSKHINPWRILIALIVIVAILNPSFKREKRTPNKSTVIVAIDDSTSQSLENRRALTKDVVDSLIQTINELEHYNIVTIRSDSTTQDTTLLWQNIRNALNDIPIDQRAGIIIVSDGQIHDVPPDEIDDGIKSAPIHLILSGKKNAFDRRITITSAPPYGVVNDTATVKFIVHGDGKNEDNKAITTTVTTSEDTYRINGVIGKEQTITLTLNKPGQNIVRLSIPDTKGEVTTINNQTAAVINGVRDRLKVLLVTGSPYAGSRMWRDLLKSDPGIDLVHFTILREPDKINPVPSDELSLIAFPFRELFEVKLYDFDLIVFDKYKQNVVLPDRYFQNIQRYVREGGGIFVISGPDFTTRGSLANTGIGAILPALPNGRTYNKAFKPSLTKRGDTHPVTAPIKPYENEWGAWLQQAGTDVEKEENILMRGTNNAPILVLNRQDKGRVAQLLSDHVYLWQKNYDGGGPATELLRRTVHWLMKQPELDEQALFTRVDGMTITVRDYPTPGNSTSNIVLTAPDGITQSIPLTRVDDSAMTEARIDVKKSGIYSISRSEGYKTFVQIGDSNPREFQPAIASSAPLNHIIDQSNGAVIWADETGAPDIRMRVQNTTMSGRQWIGMHAPHSFKTNKIQTFPIIPVYVWLIIILSAFMLLWWREGQAT